MLLSLLSPRITTSLDRFERPSPNTGVVDGRRNNSLEDSSFAREIKAACGTSRLRYDPRTPLLTSSVLHRRYVGDAHNLLQDLI